MKFTRVFLAAAIAVSVSGCSNQISAVDESANPSWVDASGIEFIYDHRTGVPTAPEVLDELTRQAASSGSSVEWSQDAYGVPGALELYVDDVFLSSD